MAKQQTDQKAKELSTNQVVEKVEDRTYEKNGKFMRKGQLIELPEPEDVTHEELDLTEEDVLEMYENMLLQRRFERMAKKMYTRQKIAGFLHLYIGQEAVSTGSVWAVNDDDPVITAYRDHGLGLARGMDPGACMAELYGKIDGCSRGKGGSMHFFSKEHAFFGGHGIVGGCVPLGTGIAFAQKYKDTGRVCLTYLGDGASNIGAFYEAANLAGLYDLPQVLIIENNDYGMGTSVVRSAAEPQLYRRAPAFRMKGRVINGMDVFSVYKAVKEHAEMARNNEPSLLEIRTYRYEGHSMSDPADYRGEDEMEDMQKKDPTIILKKYILEEGLADNDDLDAIDEKVKDAVDEAIEFAENSSFPDEQTIYEDIYAQEDYPFLTD